MSRKDINICIQINPFVGLPMLKEVRPGKYYFCHKHFSLLFILLIYFHPFFLIYFEWSILQKITKKTKSLKHRIQKYLTFIYITLHNLYNLIITKEEKTKIIFTVQFLIFSVYLHCTSLSYLQSDKKIVDVGKCMLSINLDKPREKVSMQKQITFNIQKNVHLHYMQCHILCYNIRHIKSI